MLASNNVLQLAKNYPFFYILNNLSTRLPERPNMYLYLLHKIKKLPLGSCLNRYDELKAV